MKVAVSLPDPVFNAAEKLAAQLRVPRSQLYAEALSAYLDTHSAAAVRQRLDALYATESADLDESLMQAQAQAIFNETW